MTAPLQPDQWKPPTERLPGRFSGYRIHDPETPLGRGGFGAVWRASSADLPGIPIAIKFSLDDLRAFAVQEADSTLKVLHPNITRAFAVLDLRPHRNEGWCSTALVMQYYETSLDQVIKSFIKSRERIPFDLALSWLRDVVNAIKYLHLELNIVHRDIKPHNILLQLQDKQSFLGQASNLIGSQAILSDLGTAVHEGEPTFYLEDDGYKAREIIDPNIERFHVSLRRLKDAEQEHKQIRLTQNSRSSQDIYAFGLVIRDLRKIIEPEVFQTTISHDDWLKELQIACTHDDVSSRLKTDELIRKIETGPTTESQRTWGTGEPFYAIELTTHESELRRSYLTWLIEKHQALKLPGMGDGANYLEIKLRKIFVALKAIRSTSDDFVSARDLSRNASQNQPPNSQTLDEFHVSTSLSRRNRKFEPMQSQTAVVNIADAFADDRKLVILGDPGSGKTTLLRWLTLQFAWAIDDRAVNATIPAMNVNFDADINSPEISLGPTRLPILVRASDFAAACEVQRSLGKTPLRFIEFLGHHPWMGQFPENRKNQPLPPRELNSLFKKHIEQGQAIILIDGLDEIDDQKIRNDHVVKEIQDFIHLHLSDSRYVGCPGDLGGNQIVITSRVVGYHLAPIEGPNIRHVTIEPMQESAIRKFSDQWVSAYFDAYPEARFEAGNEHTIESYSQTLQEAIFNPRTPRIKELASNPLLMTLIAMVFRKNQNKIPPHRSQLYHDAIAILSSRWVAELTPWFQNSNREPRDLIKILAPVAAHIHKYYPSGLIPKNEFLGKIKDRLAQVMKTSKEITDADLMEFARALEKRIGFITERGPNLYGFVHQTFQEYLAGIELLRDATPSSATETIRQNLGIPRWREPILFAFGAIGCKPVERMSSAQDWDEIQRYEFLNLLLQNENDPVNELIPRGPLLVARALDEMPNVPRDIVGTLTRSLLEAYSDRTGKGQDPNVRKLIEKAFTRLTFDDERRKLVEDELCTIISKHDADSHLPAAISSLLIHIEWFSSRLVRHIIPSLQAGSDLGGEWNWPIQHYLKSLLCPASPLKEPTKPVVQESALEKLRETDWPAYGELLRNYKLALDQYDDKFIRYETRRKLSEVAIQESIAVFNDHQLLPFRSFLMDEVNQDCLDHIHCDAGWEHLIVALFGGYHDFNSVETLRDYRKIALFLQQSDLIRRSEIDEHREDYVARFGYDDIVYNAAVYLDTGMDGRLGSLKNLIRFRPDAIYRDSPLSDLLIANIKAKTSSRDLISIFIAKYSSTAQFLIRQEVIVALIALGENPVSHGILLDSRMTEAVTRRLDQLKCSLEDAVTRAIRQAKATNLLKQLAERNHPISQWNSMLSAVANLTTNFCDQPFDAESLIDLSGPYHLLPLAEYWSERFASNVSDDVIYRLAVALDKIPTVSPQDLDASFNLLYRAANRSWEGARLLWRVDHLPYPPQPGDVVSPSAIDAMDDLQTEEYRPGFRQVVRSEFLNNVIRLTDESPEIKPELIILNTVNVQWLNRDDVSRRNRPRHEVHTLSDIKIDIWHNVAVSEENPYHRARALLRLAKYNPAMGRAFASEALGQLSTITDPYQKCRVLELAMPFQTTGTKRKYWRGELAKAAANIQNAPATRARALARAANFAEEKVRVTLFADAIETCRDIVDSAERAETLSLLWPYISMDPKLANQAREVVDTLFDPLDRATALRQFGPHILALEASANAEDQAIWRPICLASFVLDMRRRLAISSSTTPLWKNMLTSPEETAISLCAEGQSKGLELNFAAATSIDECLKSGHENALIPLLPLLENPTAAATPIVERWLSIKSDIRISAYASLYLSERDRRLHDTTVDGLIDLATDLDHDDHARLRASLVLQGPIIVLKRERRERAISELGASICERLAERLLEFSEKGPIYGNWVLGQTFQDILFDSTSMVRDWCNQLRNSQIIEPNQSEVLWVLMSQIYDCTPDVWLTLEQEFERTDGDVSRVRDAILRSVLRCMKSDNQPKSFNVGETIWPTLASFKKTAEVRIIPRTTCSPLQAIHEARTTEDSTEPSILAKQARALLRNQFSVVWNEEKGGPKTWNEFIDVANHLVWVHDMEFPGNLFDVKAKKLFEMIEGEPPGTLAILGHWLREVLASPIQTSDWYFRERSWLLFITTLFATREPDLFAKLAVELRLERHLRDVILEPAKGSKRPNKTIKWEPARIAAVRLLGKMHSLEERSVDALQKAILDEAQVRSVANHVFANFPRLNGSNVLAKIIDGLNHESSLIVLASAKVLAIVSKAAETMSEVQEQIIKQFIEVIHRLGGSVPGSFTRSKDVVSHQIPRPATLIPDRGIFDYQGQGTSDDDQMKLGYRGSLREALLKILLEITGGF
jgi:serine/threonine protein kinase